MGLHILNLRGDFMFNPVLYKEKTAISLPRKFLDDKEYTDALEAFVLVCTDCVFIHKKRRTFYLARRKSKPMSDWWFIGGRSYAGEEELASMRRCLKRETGLDINPDRFEFLTMKRYFFKDRQQAPQDKGCDSLCYIFAVFATDEEITIASSNLDPKEYDSEFGLKEFGPEELANENVFSSIIDLYEYFFPGAVVRRPTRMREEEQWIIHHCPGKTFEWSKVRILGKPEISRRKLEDRIPNDKKTQAHKLSNKGEIKLEDVGMWSQLSAMLGVPLLMCVEDSMGFEVTFYYTVFPDGTVEHQSVIDPEKHEQRRPVKPNEKRKFFKSICTIPNTLWQNEPVPLEGVD